MKESSKKYDAMVRVATMALATCNLVFWRTILDNFVPFDVELTGWMTQEEYDSAAKEMWDDPDLAYIFENFEPDYFEGILIELRTCWDNWDGKSREYLTNADITRLRKKYGVNQHAYAKYFSLLPAEKRLLRELNYGLGDWA